MACANVVYKCQVKGCNYETAFPNNLSKHTNHYKGSCGDEPLLSVGGHCSTSTTPVDPPLQQLEALDCERQLDVEIISLILSDFIKGMFVLSFLGYGKRKFWLGYVSLCL